jgi:hypothetical protein
MLAAAIAVWTVSCAHHLDRKLGPTLQTVDMTAPVLQAHMRDGSVYVLDHWTIDDRAQVIHGTGQKLGADRVPLAVAGPLEVRIPDVALFETNTIATSASVGAMAVITGVSAVVTAACIANPKACFGSCPTFYAPDDATGQPVLQAEGFSDAIAPALEKHDLDSLYRTTGHGGPFTLTVTNEAYETHVIKQADLLVVQRPPGGRVLATPEELWLASSVVPPAACTAAEGDCTEAVRALDGVERTSLTDDHDLAARETIDLRFDGDARALAGGRLGLAIGARQTLVTTFLMYQGLAYLGTRATEWLAKLERGDALASAGGRALRSLVGGIEVQLQGDDGAWHTVDEIYETGPLATDVHLALLPEGARAGHVRLRLPKGGWRIDHVALATLTGPATPVRISPDAIHGALGAEYAGGRRVATAFPIVTLPGDRYELHYTLPPGDDYELVLDSRGYYLEWMRDAWLREENPLAALAMFLDPARAMRELAPAYKKLEPTAEKLFWSSRYAHP